MSLPEGIAVLLAIAYLALAIRQNIWCWLCAGISAAIFVYLFAEARLYMQALLNGFYFAMAIYGFVAWRSGKGEDGEMPVSTWPPRLHIIAVVAIFLLSVVSGYLLVRYTDSAYPYVDSLIAFAAVWTTFLVARKVLENWWYWLVIDAASVAVYWSRELELTALLFVVYLVMVPFGLIRWTRTFREQLLAVP